MTLSERFNSFGEEAKQMILKLSDAGIDIEQGVEWMELVLKENGWSDGR